MYGVVQDDKPKTEPRRTASLTSIPHKTCVSDDMLKLVLKITSFNFHTRLISKEMKRRETLF